MLLQGYDLSRSFLTVSALDSYHSCHGKCDLAGLGWHVLACNGPSVHLHESTLLFMFIFIFTEPYRVRQCHGLQIRSLHESSASCHSLLRL